MHLENEQSSRGSRAGLSWAMVGRTGVIYTTALGAGCWVSAMPRPWKTRAAGNGRGHTAGLGDDEERQSGEPMLVVRALWRLSKGLGGGPVWAVCPQGGALYC